MKKLLLLVIVAACGRSAPPMATAGDAQRANVELADLQHGRQLLVRKCGNCHKPPLPSDHTPIEWPVKLDEMSARAGLDREQRHLIEKYLVVMAEQK